MLKLERPTKSSCAHCTVDRHWQMTRRNPIPLGVTARQHLSPIIEDYHPSRVSLDTSFEKRAHERQVVAAVKNFPKAVPITVAGDELDSVLAFDRLTLHLQQTFVWKFSADGRSFMAF